jgi:hypothetical protein
MSRFSSVGESFKPINDHMSCMTGPGHIKNRHSFKFKNDDTYSENNNYADHGI